MAVVGVLCVLLLLALLLGVFLFWLWMLIDCATREADTGNDKLVWIVIILFAHIVGAAVYYFVRRPRRYAELGR